MAVASAQSGPYFTTILKEKRPIDLNVGKVAVFQDPARRAPSPDWRQLGFVSGEHHPAQGWGLGIVSLASRTPAGIEQKVAALAGQAGIDFVSPVFYDDFGGPMVISRTILMRFNEGVTAAEASAVIRKYGATVLDTNYGGMPNAYRLKLPSKNGFDTLAVANQLAAEPKVRFAEPNYLMSGRSSWVPNDPLFPQQWGLRNLGGGGNMRDFDIRIVTAWDVTRGNSNVITLIIDDGVQMNHPDINQVPGVDTTSDAGLGGPMNPADVHGTLVAGVVSGIADNGIGIAGVAPGTRIASGRAHINDGQEIYTEPDWVIRVLEWGVIRGVRVTNNSNAYGFESQALNDMYHVTSLGGIVHFAASGNDGGGVLYPARIPSVNAVGAVGANGFIWPLSNRGAQQAFVAPGVNIPTTDRTGPAGISQGNYAVVSGTSFAAPHAAGVAALMLSLNPNLSADQVTAVMQSTCWDLPLDIWPPDGRDDIYGHGLIDASRAIGAGALKWVSVNPSPIFGGTTATGMVSLYHSIPDEDPFGFSLMTDSPHILSMPPRVMFGGALVGFFTISSVGVDIPIKTKIIVSQRGVWRITELDVLPAELQQFTVTPNNLTGGNSAIGRVQLQGRAGPAGRTVILRSNSTALSVPPTVVVAPNQNQATFPVNTAPVGFTAVRSITATLDNVTLTVNVTLNPVITEVQSITVNPATVMGGNSSRATVTLTKPAPFGGIPIALASNSALISMPTMVAVPAGSTTRSFDVNTGFVGTTSVATLFASWNGVTRTTSLTITPTLRLDYIRFSSNTVRGGFPVNCTVGLLAPAPVGGVVVQLSSDIPEILVPPSVTVPAGKNFVTFSVNTQTVPQFKAGTVTATHNGVNRHATLELRP